MRTVLLLVALAACQSAAPKPAIANEADCTQPPQVGERDPMHPYYFAGACVDIPHRCNINDCRAWKVERGADANRALEACIQECPCGE